MFWKFLVSVLLLPSCLGFEIAAASIKNEVQTLSKSEELTLPMQQTEANQDVVNSSLFSDREYSSIPRDQQAVSRELKHTEYQQPYLIAHRYHHGGCLQGGHRYYLRGYYYPEYTSYHRHYHHRNVYYRYRNYYPQYYRHGYYHQPYYHHNGYYRHGDYHHNGYSY
ncbi:MAG: hypothetical protein DSM106950_29985 [Stigonema ocellatum SAG 48.90 = DSM 106950]|nr:hypothetical protein [Stigonema ocellatum SAG 48.90 = DSM 106950]